jgi:hypothetical protein
MLGQVGYHLLAAAHRTHAPWPVVAAVACLPVVTPRVLDMRHRHANRGRPISRDRLKAALGIATNTASALTHIIRAEQRRSRESRAGRASIRRPGPLKQELAMGIRIRWGGTQIAR